MVTIADLGILRDVADDEGTVVVTITPTYTGCPAMPEIRRDVERRMREAGFADVAVRTRLAPAWTSDWITAEGRRKLRDAGIAGPDPVARRAGPVPLTLGAPPGARCPRCGSRDTSTTAAFGATACRSLHRCASCGEPFERVRTI